MESMQVGAGTSTRRAARADNARVVADVIRQSIVDGAYPTGLPLEDELAREFRVSRNTVRVALSSLRAEGWIDRTPRLGTTVAQRPVDHRLDCLRGLKETLVGYGEVRNAVRIATVLVPPPVVARKLELAVDEQVVYLERIRQLDGETISLDLTYLVSDIGIPLLDADLETNDVFPLIEQVAGCALGDADLSLSAAAADAHSAVDLDVAAGSPVLLLERLTRLADGRPVDLEYIRMRADRITMRGNVSRIHESENR
ncbi:GntR family transcriptional regulator [Tsukamurella sp. 8F]|uniref:GntR family transcriptional regulator n=1 Tax=unclassified Tsukamurella TaxID=2633480 RepID=UPI0023B8A9FB|nr:MULTISPECIES: GntR family transcriptional regulator [unclassified Tsukamurella]MDF0528610.1 GntR family transcriptional regulator [Tsukamurella sp. 8J]MDF0585572.1 GntR family transcriptional regulator [Tsukamurella sp. 8F]